MGKINKRLRSCSAGFDLMYLIFDLIYLIFYLIYLIVENTIDLILNAGGKINKRLKTDNQSSIAQRIIT